MRLERLDLAGFGRLRDLTAEFAPGITVILGPNESGKTTIQRAVRAALFGLDAGGQGRPVERSEWFRWQPWSSGPYGYALTYRLADGRRFRVAARLDQRDQRIEVHEIGGGNVTASMRTGRQVAPGAVHLGIDEAVFCATGWLDEDGLRLDSSDTPTGRAGDLQEALERLADSGDSVTAADALGRIHEAEQRIGTPRRASSPLGAATARLSALDAEIATARRRVEALASEQERLRDLESQVADSTALHLDCERRWLRGKIAVLDMQLTEMQGLREIIEMLGATLQETAPASDIPLGSEERVTALGGELRQAIAQEQLAQEAKQAVAAELSAVVERRQEIHRGLAALGGPQRLPHHVGQAAVDIRAALTAEVAGLQRVEDDEAQSRRESLRREIAATGLGSLPAGSAELVANLLLASSRGSAAGALGWISAALVLGGAVAEFLLLRTFHGVAWLAVLIAAFVLLSLLAPAAIARGRAGEARRARRQLRKLCPQLDQSREGMSRTLSRLPAVAALHNELQRQEIVDDSRAEERRDILRRIVGLGRDATELAALAAVPVNHETEPGPHGSEVSLAERALDAIDEARRVSDRGQELDTEDARLSEREAELNRLGEAAARATAAVNDIETTLRRLLASAQLPSDMPVSLAVGAFRDACAARRRHEAAAKELDQALNRLTRLGREDSLRALADELRRQLRDRGVDPDLGVGEPLDAAELAALEREVERARQTASAAGARAGELRGRLGGMMDTAPPLADLEDERASCAAARARALHQLEALHRAAQIIEETTRSVHRDIAPRLAASVADRLALVTDGRYEAVNVDIDHFEVALLGSDRPELIPLTAASHGTRDQVSLLLRLGLVEILSGHGETIPLFLDEPLITADPVRRSNAITFLLELSRSHQVVLTTSDPDLATTVLARGGSECSVIQLAQPMQQVDVSGTLVDLFPQPALPEAASSNKAPV